MGLIAKATQICKLRSLHGGPVFILFSAIRTDLEPDSDLQLRARTSLNSHRPQWIKR